ncbi:MAG TPA: PadR family transcriptional regulator [Acidobacteriota bacterium]|nr:PadR family transcriptional regulator [Acidobacteriota bacterium]
MEKSAGFMPGMLEMLILKAVSLGPAHGYGILLRIEKICGQAFGVEQGSLYPALNRLEHRGLLDSEWGVSDNNRRAKYYQLTAAGEKRLQKDSRQWTRLSQAVETALKATPEEA